MISALHSLYLVERLDAPAFEGEVLLPERARRVVHDFLVLSAGPGRLRENGKREPLQATTADRVVVQPHDVRPFEGQQAFVSDADLVAVVRGPEWSRVEPCNDWVFIEVDPPPVASNGSVVVARHGLPSGERRFRERGMELHQQFAAKDRELIAAGAPQYERHRRLAAWRDDLRGSDREALRIAVEGKGETGYKMLYTPNSSKAANTGTVAAWGPGKLAEGTDRFEDCERVPTAWRVPTRVEPGERGWGIIPKHARVVFDRGIPSVDLYDGARFVSAYPVEALMAVEVE